MKVLVYILSDGKITGLGQIIKKAMTNFSRPYEIKEYMDIYNLGSLTEILTSAIDCSNLIIYHSFTDSKMDGYVKKFIRTNDLNGVSIIDFVTSRMSYFLNEEVKPYGKGSKYIEDIHARRINALDFAIRYDDGQDFKGLEFCDIALIGVSRSSKTPLTMYLASLGYKVSNIPILVDSKIPKGLFEIEPKKIFGLTVDKEALKRIREERLKSLGLSTDSLYSSKERIDREVDYALELMNDLDCTIIDTTYRSIEETSDLIINNLNNNKEREKL